MGSGGGEWCWGVLPVGAVDSGGGELWWSGVDGRGEMVVVAGQEEDCGCG